nr:UvrD-helicase domain-containing protein [Chitinophagales bacterium]
MNFNNIRHISASAGSGKTYRLTKELAALLNKKNTPYYHPSQIIATTFTRSAAAELRNRVREEILEQGDLETVSLLDQSLIGTVNSISGQLLSLFSFDIGLSPVLRVIEDEEKDIFFQVAISGSLNEEVLSKMNELGERFSVKQSDIRQVIQSIADYARSNEISKETLQGSRDDSVRSILCRQPEAQKEISKSKSELFSIIPPITAEVNRINDQTKKTRNCLHDLDKFYYHVKYKHIIPWADWAALTKLCPGSKSKKAGLFDEVIKRASAHIQFWEFQNDIKEYIDLCFNTAIDSLGFYHTLKKERGLIDFVDEEAYLITALDKPEVRHRFAQQFKILMVDEFQDTSPLQLALFLKISSLVEKVIWVGDPKQSIYGFRGSDSELTNTVTKILGQPAPEDILQTSYRSRPELVEIVNSLFLPAFQRLENHLSKEQIELKAHRKQNKKLHAAFQFWGFKWAGSKKTNNAKFNSQLAARVADFINSKPLIEDQETKFLREAKPGDVAILCRNNIHCRELANALRDQGVQAVVANTGLQRTAEWRLLKACLHLLLDERDTLSKAEIQFLTSENHDVETLLDDRLQFLEDAGHNDYINYSWLNDHETVKWINEHRTHLKSQSISGIVQLMYSGLDFQSLVMQWDNGAQRIANLQQMLMYATLFEDYCAKLGLLSNAHGFLTWFDVLAENEKDARGVVANEFAVNVLTYHKAKGLEWPVVILYGLDEEHDLNLFSVRVIAKDRMEFEKPLEGRTLRYWPWPYGSSQYGLKRGYEKFKELCNEAEDYNSFNEKEKAEQLRLLYVGFTRARDYLIINYKTEKKQLWLQLLIEDDIETLTGVSTNNYDDEVNINKHFNSMVRIWISSYSDFAKPIKSVNRWVDVF